MFKTFNALFAASMLFAVVGCSSVGVDEDTADPSVPAAENDPFGAGSGDGYGTNGPGSWTDANALNNSGAGADQPFYR